MYATTCELGITAASQVPLCPEYLTRVSYAGPHGLHPFPIYHRDRTTLLRLAHFLVEHLLSEKSLQYTVAPSSGSPTRGIQFAVFRERAVLKKPISEKCRHHVARRGPTNPWCCYTGKVFFRVPGPVPEREETPVPGIQFLEPPIHCGDGGKRRSRIGRNLAVTRSTDQPLYQPQATQGSPGQAPGEEAVNQPLGLPTPNCLLHPLCDERQLGSAPLRHA